MNKYDYEELSNNFKEVVRKDFLTKTEEMYAQKRKEIKELDDMYERLLSLIRKKTIDNIHSGSLEDVNESIYCGEGFENSLLALFNYLRR
jgi:hypothetical protein